jgi:hypothetical protein
MSIFSFLDMDEFAVMQYLIQTSIYMSIGKDKGAAQPFDFFQPV